MIFMEYDKLKEKQPQTTEIQNKLTKGLLGNTHPSTTFYGIQAHYKDFNDILVNKNNDNHAKLLAGVIDHKPDNSKDSYDLANISNRLGAVRKAQQEDLKPDPTQLSNNFAALTPEERVKHLQTDLLE